MTSSWKVALTLVALTFSGATRAEDEDLSRSLTMKCQYSDYGTFEGVSVSITQGTAEPVEGVVPASTKTFKRGGTPIEQVVFRVASGQFAECIFPSAQRVRLKVGEGTARAYGACGGDPQVFASVWVDRRKILSRHWFAGHCLEDRGDASSFSLQITPRKVVRCQTLAPPGAAGNVLASAAAPQSSAQPLTACVDFPDVARFPVDRIEYPLPGARAAAVGSVEVLRGSHPVCRLVADAVADSRSSPTDAKVSLARPTYDETSADLPGELNGGTESTYDFNNDGALDRIFHREFENTYMHGSTLLVQLGTARGKLRVTGSPLGSNSILAPCQMGTTQYSIDSCPPLSQKGDGSGFSMRSRPGEARVYFRGRYADVKPFFFRGSTYVEVASNAGESSEFVAVLKPLPNRTFKQMCLLRTVPENL